MKRVAFKTVGCRLNQAETAGMAAGFHARGYRVVPFGEPCEVCVVHTCAVTRKAETDCVRLARSARRHGAETVILAGCAAEVAGEKLRQRAGADLAIGQSDKWRLAEMLAEAKVSGVRCQVSDEARGSEPRQCHPNAADAEGLAAPAPLPLFTTTRALVKVQDGCDFRCAYCIVPRARGRPRSRPARQIVAEVTRLAKAGFREIALTGANLGCYADGPVKLPELIAAVEAVEGIERIRLSSIEVSTVERAVIECMAGSTKLCPAIHVPLQSGDDGVLRAMGRRYTAAEYRRLADYALARIPLLGLGTDVLVGFPGEDDAAFANTLRLVEDIPFSNLHVFSYSKRPGTPAADMAEQVPEAVKKTRSRQLIELGRRKQDAFAHRFVEREVSVLIEDVTSDPDVQASGWTRERVAARLRLPSPEVNQVVTFIPSRAANGVLC